MTCRLELFPEGKVLLQGTPFIDWHFQRIHEGWGGGGETHSSNGTTNNGTDMGQTSSKCLV